MKRKYQNTDFMDTMELPTIRPEMLDQDETDYDGSYDYYNDPERKSRPRPKKRPKRPRTNRSNCRTTANRTTSRGRKIVSNSTAATTDSFNIQTVLAVILAMVLVSVSGVIFYLIANGFNLQNGDSSNQQELNPYTAPSVIETTSIVETTAKVETTIATAEATTEEPAETTISTEATTETTLQETTTAIETAIEPTTQAETAEPEIVETAEPEIVETAETEIEELIPPIPTEANSWDVQDPWPEVPTEAATAFTEETETPTWPETDELW